MRTVTGYTSIFVFLVLVVAYSGCAPRDIGRSLPPSAADALWPNTGTWAAERLDDLTLEQKVSQLFAVPAYGRYSSTDDPEYRRLVDLVENFGLGGVIFFQGEPLNQVVMANDLQERADIPLLVSQDMEWGAGMRLPDATTFPHTMAIGATRDPALAYAAGYITGKEARALGVQQIFAPVADVNNNPFNPIINVRSFSEQPELVATLVNAFVEGAQDAGVIATLKHFPGHGDTATDSHADLPILPFSLSRLDTLELVPFKAAVNRGVKSVMTGHLALPEIDADSTLPASLSRRVTTSILRNNLGFEGLVVTDALDMRGVTKNYSTGEIAVMAVRAGADMLLMSEDPYAARAAILKAVNNGQISEELIDASVTRILRAKEWLGLHKNHQVSVEAVRKHVGTHEHVSMSEHIARESLTLLRNEGDILPLTGDPRRILNVVISDSDAPSVADYLNEQLSIYGGAHDITNRLLGPAAAPGDLQAVIDEAAEYDVILIPAFVYVRSWSGIINLAPAQRDFIDRLVSTGKPVILVSLGNPYIIMGLQKPDAYVATYSGSRASQKAVAQALFGKAPMHGRLPVTIPDEYPFGAGMDLEQVELRTGYAEEVGMVGVKLSRIDSLMHAAISDTAFPGAAVAVGREGVLPALKSYGYFTYDGEAEVSALSLFDMASLTKVIATTTAAMLLYEEGRLDLDAPVTHYLPAFGQNGKERVTIRHLLTHTSGLIPYRAFHREGILTRQAVLDTILAEPLQYEPGTRARYSDLGMITFALVVEKITGRDFAEYVREEIFEPLDMTLTDFRSTGKTDPAIVPTEVDTTFRHRLIQGEVHDETAWILGGVAGHAGLFSNVRDLANFAYMLSNGGQFGGRQFLKPETIKYFTTPVDLKKHTRALGWDTRSLEGYSSAGQFFGPRSFGHTGFTGTSIWIDPDQKLFVVLLTNRVYPTRDNLKIMPVRAEIADITFSSIEGPAVPTILTRLERQGLLPENQVAARRGEVNP